MKHIDYDDRQYRSYAKARAMSPATRDAWLRAFADRLDDHRPLTVLDLGSGTGRLTPGLAETFGRAIGVEPSEQMRRIAEEASSHPRVEYVPGAAEELPLPDASVDAAVLFLSWHHVQDQERAARELARVVRPSGALFLRTQFSDRMPRLWWLAHFPRGYEADAAMYETLAATTAVLGSAGWQVDELAELITPAPRTLAEELERLRHRNLTTFDQLTDDELRVGFERLERAVAERPDDQVPAYPESLLVARLP